MINSTGTAAPLGTAFTYQGRLAEGSSSANGSYDLKFTLYDAASGPAQVGSAVTNAATGASVVVRVNDRGPFLHDRLIDLSFAAATRVGIAQKGSGEVEVEAIVPTESSAAAAPLPPVAPSVSGSPPQDMLPPVAESAAADAKQGFVGQLGAFANHANAQVFLAHVQNQMATAEMQAVPYPLPLCRRFRPCGGGHNPTGDHARRYSRGRAS